MSEHVWWYRYAGLAVRTEFALPEWQPFTQAQPDEKPDVVIRRVAGNHDAFAPQIGPQTYRFRIDEIADYSVRKGCEIDIAPHPGAGEREVRLFLLGSAWGALCYQRGVLALHASVVNIGGQAIAFCGPSGAGKSSCAAWLVAHGHALICDDLCHVDLREPARVHPAPPRLKLWQDALDRLGWQSASLERDHFRLEKFHLPQNDIGQWLGHATTPSPVPLAAIFVLAWGQPALERLAGLRALTALVENATYRGDLLESMGQMAAHWQRCATLARQAPVFLFSRPRNWSEADAAMQLVLDEAPARRR